MAERKFFRTTFRGFSKQDVLAHIDTLHAQQQEELEDMKAQVALAEQASAAARAEADAVIALPNEQLTELEQLRETVASYEQQLQKLGTDLEESNKALAALWEQQKHWQDYIARADGCIADAQALADQLAARFRDYGLEPTPVSVTATVNEPSVAETENEDEEEPSTSRRDMANWLF